MRTLATLITSLALTISGLAFSPAHAIGTPVNYLCTTGEPAPNATTGFYTITDGVVSAGTSCVGDVVIAAGATSIGVDAFSLSQTITSVTFAPGSTLASIGDGAFYQVPLTSITIPAGVTSIGVQAFSRSTLTSITIPAGVTSIGAEAFSGATQLAAVTFAPGSALTSIEESVFRRTGALTSITIPDGVTSIGADAFYYAIALTSVTLPDSLISIGDGAFWYSGLTSITIPASVSTLSGTPFSRASSLNSIYFLGNAPTALYTQHCNVLPCSAPATAYKKIGATGFDLTGNPPRWKGLSVTNFPSVTYNSNGGSLVDADSFIPGGSIVQAPATPTKSGYTFAGWSAMDNGAALTFPYSPPVTTDVTIYAKWSLIPVVDPPAPAVDSPAPTLESQSQAVVSDLAARTIGFKKKYSVKALAQQVGVTIVSPKAKVSISVAKASKKICAKSGSSIKTLKAGNCEVTFTVQEPKPKGGKKPAATKTVKTLVVQ